MGGTAMAAAIREAAGVFLDALPYVDQEYSSIDGIRKEVEKLVRDEMSSFRPKTDYLEAFPSVPDLSFSDSQLLKDDFERMKRNESMPKPDMTRYQLFEEPQSDAAAALWK